METKYIWNSSSETEKSTSSGAFYLIARRFFEIHKNAAVYGCAFDKDFVARHCRADSIDELSKFQGSKYVQSEMLNVYDEVKDDLSNGTYVLFSGTACQTVAMTKFLNANYDRFFAIDVLCHGVPSPKLWREYLGILQEKERGQISSISFRNKSATNRLGYILQYTVGRRTKKIFPEESEYYSSFIGNKSLRPSCYNCPFVGMYIGADLTLGDSNSRVFHPTEAISLAVIRTDKGKELINYIKDQCEMTDADYDEDAKTNKKLVEAALCPIERYSYYSEMSTEILSRKSSLVQFIKNRVKNMIPTSIKNHIRR